jgi:hypothetical protein
MVTRINLSSEGPKILGCNYFNTMFHASFIILHCDQQTHNYFSNYHTPSKCFDTPLVSSSGSLQSIPCQVTQVCPVQLLVIQFTVFFTEFLCSEISKSKIFRILQFSYLGHFVINRKISMF